MLNFDSNGYLNPSKIFELNKDEFESVFAINKHRQSLLKSLNALLIDLKKLSNIPLKIWIDGSFITKKEYPKDIDIVVF